jgi:hypothetical protein
MKIYPLLFVFLICFSFSRAETDYSSVLEKQNSLQFMKNQGQFDDAIAYKSHYGNISLAFLKNQAISYCISREIEGVEEEKTNSLPDFLREKEKPKPKEYLTWNQTWLNINKNAKVYELSHSKSKCNYFIGNDSSKWVKNADQYAELKYENIYTNVDAHYYSKEGKFKYDYIVKPGGSITDIKVSYEGIKKLMINEKGQLIIQTAWGEFIEEAPYSFLQETKQEVKVEYQILNDSTFGFTTETYNKNQTLVIDPYSLCWSTFLGGTGSYYSEFLEVTNFGEPIIAGWCDNTHPITPGVFQSIYAGGYELFISKLNIDGSNLIFSTFLGGVYDDYISSLHITSSFDVVVFGFTYSMDFPTTLSSFQPNWGGGVIDCFISKLSSDGSSLIFSTFIGGDSKEEILYAELIPSGDILFSGYTYSNNFPTSFGAYQSVRSGGFDGFICLLTSNGSNMSFSTYLGGIYDDYVSLLKLKPSGEILAAGNTYSNNFPTTSGAYQTAHSGGLDLFLAEMNNNGTNLNFSTFFGGNNDEYLTTLSLSSSSDIIVFRIYK